MSASSLEDLGNLPRRRRWFADRHPTALRVRERNLGGSHFHSFPCELELACRPGSFTFILPSKCGFM